MKTLTFTQLSFSFSITSMNQITLGKIINAVTQLLKYCLKSNNTQTISRSLSSLKTVKNQINEASIGRNIPPPPPSSLLNTTKNLVKIQVINRSTNAKQDNMSNRALTTVIFTRINIQKSPFTGKSAHRSLHSFTNFHLVQTNASLGNRLSL